MNQSGWLAVHVSQGFKVECCSLPHIGGWESPHDASEISCEKNPPGAFGLRSPWLLTTHSQVSGWSSLRIDTSKECPSESLVISVPDMKHRDVSWDHVNWVMDILDKGILKPTYIQNNYLYCVFFVNAVDVNLSTYDSSQPVFKQIKSLFHRLVVSSFKLEFFLLERESVIFLTVYDSPRKPPSNIGHLHIPSFSFIIPPLLGGPISPLKNDQSGPSLGKDAGSGVFFFPGRWVVVGTARGSFFEGLACFFRARSLREVVFGGVFVNFPQGKRWFRGLNLRFSPPPLKGNIIFQSQNLS